MRVRTSVLAALAAVALVAAGCGGDDEPDGVPAKRAIPASVRSLERGAVDTANLVLAGDRAKAVASADALGRAADGPAAGDLADAGVAAAQVDELKARAAEVDRIAARGRPIAVALAANRVLELVPDLFAAYADRVPAQVTRLGYLDAEARFQALAGDRGRAADAVAGLEITWKELRKKVVRRAGGDAPAEAYDAHVRALRDLANADGETQPLAAEAQRGRKLVDDLAAVYTR